MAKLKRLGLGWLQGASELLLYFPVLACLYVYVPDISLSLPLWLAAMSLLYALGYAFFELLPIKRQWQAAIAAIAAPAAAAWLLGGPALVLVIDFALLFVAWLRGSLNRARGWDRAFFPGLMWIGLVAYFLASFMFPRFPELEPLTPWVTGLGIASLAFALYRTNSTTLDKETLQKEGAAKPQISMETKWRNRLLLLALFIFIVAVGAIRVIAETVGATLSYLFFGTMRLIYRLMSLFTSESPPDSAPPDQPPTDISGILEPAEPSAFAVFMDRAVYYIAMLLLGAALIAVLYLVGKYAARGLRRLMSWYGERLDVGNDRGFVDEKQSLLDVGQWAKERTDHWRNRVADLFRREPGWDDLKTNGDRIRHAYRRLLLGRIAGGYVHNEGRTPRETGEELGRKSPLRQEEAEAIALYEQARYGGKEVTDEQARVVRKLFDKG